MNTTTNPRTLVQAASELRSKHQDLPASIRIRWARETAGIAALWDDLEFDFNGTARIERDGFSINVEYTIDSDADYSWLGEFTDRETTTTLKNPEAWDGSRVLGGVYAYFEPANSAEDIRTWYRQNGHARHVAWVAGQRQIREDMNRARDLVVHELKVTVSHSGVELCTEYLGGVDLGNDLPNVDVNVAMVQSAIDPIVEALTSAKDAMKRIAIKFVGDATID